MRNVNTTARAALAITAAFGLMAVPAMANAADTEVSFTVTSTGALAISQAGAGALNLTTVSPINFDPLNSSPLTGDMGEVTVTDQRGGLLGAWAVSVVGENWVNAADNAVVVAPAAGHVYIDAADVATYQAAQITALKLTGATIAGMELVAGGNNLGAAYNVVSGVTSLGNGELKFTPQITVAVPTATPAGTYSATVTQTVS